MAAVSCYVDSMHVLGMGMIWECCGTGQGHKLYQWCKEGMAGVETNGECTADSTSIVEQHCLGQLLVVCDTALMQRHVMSPVL